MLDLAESHEGELLEKLIENALEDYVSAFDAFGGELYRVHADRTSRGNLVRWRPVKGRAIPRARRRGPSRLLGTPYCPVRVTARITAMAVV